MNTDRIDKKVQLRASLERVWRALSDSNEFDGIPLARRAKAFASNEEGWTAQMRLIEEYLAHAP